MRMMHKAALAIAAAALIAGAGPALAQKKQLAIVVGGRDNPFAAALADGCKKWNEEHKDAAYECVLSGPPSSGDDEGEAQIVDDLITTGAAAIAISPSNPSTMADLIRQKQPPMPIMTLDKDLAGTDHGLRRTYLGTDDYLMGTRFAEILKQARPSGGTLCVQIGAADAAGGNARLAGLRDGLAGAKGAAKLSGQNGWTEAPDCPLISGDQPATANTQLAGLFASEPDIDTVVLASSAALLDPRGYAAMTAKVAKRFKDKSLMIIAGDTLPPELDALKAGRVQALVGLGPFEMGRAAPDVMLKLIAGDPVTDPAAVEPGVCTPATVANCLTR